MSSSPGCCLQRRCSSSRSSSNSSPRHRRRRAFLALSYSLIVGCCCCCVVGVVAGSSSSVFDPIDLPDEQEWSDWSIFRPINMQMKSKPTLQFIKDEEEQEQEDESDDNDNDDSSSNKYSFRILQVADIHLGEEGDDSEQDRETFAALDKILAAEQPDLIVLTGDQLTADDVEDENASAYYYELLANKLGAHNIPWAVVMGNHDERPAKASRQQLVRGDKKHRLSLTQEGPTHLHGVTNYWIDIHHHQDHHESQQDAKDVVAARVLILDSGGGKKIPKSIEQNQIDWFWDEWLQQQDKDDDLNTAVPIFAFQHIPSRRSDFAFDNERCGDGIGTDGSVADLDYDAGIVSALHTAGNVRLLGVGHSHWKAYCCKHKRQDDDDDGDDVNNLHLCFGRHSGHGLSDRGATVYRLELDGPTGDFVGWTSYVRMESGEIVDRYDPK